MKTPPKKCFECKEGTYVAVCRPFSATTHNGDDVTVPDVLIFKCSNCGEEIIPAESSRKIENYLAAAAEQLQPEQAVQFLERFGLDQTEGADALGFGLKTFNRWCRGTQTISRSMGYYLRALARFPEVLDWIQRRRWREEGDPLSASATDTEVRGFSLLEDNSVRFAAIANTLQTDPSRLDRVSRIGTNFARSFESVRIGR